MGIGGAADWIQRYRQGHLIDLIEVGVNDEILTTAGSIPTLAHLERSDFLDKVSLLRSSVRDLSSGGWAMAAGAGALVSVGFSVVLLMQVHPLLGLLAPAALVPLWAANRAMPTRPGPGAKPLNLNGMRLPCTGSCWTRRQPRKSSFPVPRRAGRGGPACLATRHPIQGACQDQGQRAEPARLVRLCRRLHRGLVLMTQLVLGGQASIGDVMLVITLASTLRFQVRQIVEEYTGLPMQGWPPSTTCGSWTMPTGSATEGPSRCGNPAARASR